MSEVTGTPDDVTTALSSSISGAADQAAHVIHWVVVADVAFDDGTRELATMCAPNMPEWMIAGMMDYLTGCTSIDPQDRHPEGDEEDE